MNHPKRHYDEDIEYADDEFKSVGYPGLAFGALIVVIIGGILYAFL
jgi:hypothetical protein